MNIKYDIIDTKTHDIIKRGCTLEHIIPAHTRLNDDQVREYYKINESNKYWDRAHNPHRFKRYVFDKCVVPASGRFEMVPSEED